MSVLSTLVDGYYTLEVGDKLYRVKSIIDQQLQADFARWNYQRAVSDLAETRILYNDKEFAIEREKLREGYRNGAYDFKSENGIRAMQSISGLTFVCSKLIEGTTPTDVVIVLINDSPTTIELLKQILQDSFPELRLKKVVAAFHAMKQKDKRRGRRR